jgi:hypothetical protein
MAGVKYLLLHCTLLRGQQHSAEICPAAAVLGATGPGEE